MQENIKIWKKFLRENKLRFVGHEKDYGISNASIPKIWEMSIVDDEFLHFTTLDRAIEILQGGKLLMRPPYTKFGPDAVFAISLTFGTSVPKVQTTHIKDEDVVAIKFKTNVVPKQHYEAGVHPWDQYDVTGPHHREEVMWKTDVPFINQPELLDIDEAEALLLNTPEPIDEQDYVYYV